jgi:hypothetical protein
MHELSFSSLHCIDVGRIVVHSCPQPAASSDFFVCSQAVVCPSACAHRRYAKAKGHYSFNHGKTGMYPMVVVFIINMNHPRLCHTRLFMHMS